MNDARILAFLCLFSVIVGGATPFESEYVASVVEHSPVMLMQPATRDEALSVMLQNLAMYEENIADAVSKHGSQIVVFPEDGLYGAYFPTRDWAHPYLEQLPSSSSLPQAICNSSSSFATGSPVLNRASCLALQYEVYLVLVMGEVQACTPGESSDESSDPCPNDGRLQFNTQVAFDPSGRLLAKYHKTNLYFEPEWNAGNGLPVSFATSFGARFGMMICFDIMRNDPQQALLADPQVTDLAFSSWWVNNAPQITSTQQQQAWARLNGRNLLASGIGRGWYNSGSGIYAAGGRILQSFYNPTDKYVSRMLTATVPIVTSAPVIPAPLLPPPSPPSPSRSQSYPNPPLVSTLVVPVNGSGSHRVQAGQLVCQFNFTGAKLNALATGQVFGLVAQYGLYNEIFNASICSLNRCLNSNDCLSWTTSGAAQFESVSITAFLAAKEFDFVLPMFNSDDAQLFPGEMYAQSQLVVEEDQTTLKVAPRELPLLNIALFAVRP